MFRRLDKSGKYNCGACNGRHSIPRDGFPACDQLADLVSYPVEKPLSEDGKKLKKLLENVQREMEAVNSFNPKPEIKQSCMELERQVREASRKAIEQIHKIERDLLNQIRAYCQRRLNDLEAPHPTTSGTTASRGRDLSLEIEAFSQKWNPYFKQLYSIESDDQIRAAIHQAGVFQARIRELVPLVRDEGFGNTEMQFFPNVSFQFAGHQLGKLVEVQTEESKEKNKGESVDILSACNQSLLIRTHSTSIFQVQRFWIQEEALETLEGHYGGINQVVFLPDGSLASCSSDEQIKVWDQASGEELITLEGHKHWIHTIVRLPNGWLASGSTDTTIKLWDLEAQRLVRTLKGHEKPVVSLKALKNGNLVSYALDSTLKIWNPYLSENNLLLSMAKHGNRGSFIPFGILSNEYLVTCSVDNEFKKESILKVWNAADGSQEKSVSTTLKSITSVVVLSNDQVAIAGDESSLRVINLVDDRYSRTLKKAHDFQIITLLQPPSLNDRLISCGSDGNLMVKYHTIKVRKLSDLSVLQQIRTTHSDVINSVSISGDGKFLATGSVDKTIKLWSIMK